MLTQERLKKMFNYNSETGIFTRLISAGNSKKGRVTGRKDTNGYFQMCVDKKIYQSHRLAWLYVYGEWPKHQIDHINGIKTDNRIFNLRDVTPSQNQQNKIKPHKDNKTGFLGVCSNGQGFRATIQSKGNSFHIGTFDTPEKAYAAYLEAKNKVHLY